MAKFCGNCGAQMDDNARVCGMCGTPFAEATTAKETNANQLFKSSKVAGVPGVTKPGESLTKMFLAEALLFILLGILSFVKLFKAEALGLTTTFTLKQVFTDLEAVPIIVSILIFAAAVLSILPAFGEPKRRRMLLQIIVSVLAFILPVFTCIVQANSDEAVLYDFSLTFSGWLYLLFCLVTIVLSVLISKKSKPQPNVGIEV